MSLVIQKRVSVAKALRLKRTEGQGRTRTIRGEKLSPDKTVKQAPITPTL